MLLGVIPNVGVAIGLWLSRRTLLLGGGRAATAGYALLLIGLLGSAGLDLLGRALGPPILLPLVGAGSLILGLAPRDREGTPRPIRATLLALGLVLTLAFARALTPLDVFDQVGGYRIYGLMAHLLAGLGWATIGLLVLRRSSERWV
jgi:hypothetical protein